MELLRSICLQFGHEDLASFARASPQCRQAARSILFETLRIRISGPRRLQRDMAVWQIQLQELQLCDILHEIDIEGYMPIMADGGCEGGSDIDESTCKGYKSTCFPRISNSVARFPSSLYRSRELMPCFADGRGYEHPSVAVDNDYEWMPLATLLKTITSLRRLNYKCANIFPPCLLETLENYHPTCKLHIASFSMHTIFHNFAKVRPYELIHTLAEIHPYEYKLASSPCLHGITVHFACFIIANREDYDEEACQWIVRNLAPNLQEVIVLNGVGGNVRRSGPPPVAYRRLKGSPEPMSRFRAAQQELSTGKRVRPWTGFQLTGIHAIQSPKTRGRLSTLELFYEGSHPLEHLQNWSLSTDFSELRTLRINYGLELDPLAWLAEGQLFKQLHTLFIQMAPARRLEMKHWTEHCDLFCSFVRDLPPLRHLSINVNDYGHRFKRAMAAVTSTHGATLCELIVRESDQPGTTFIFDRRGVDIETLTLIQRRCPHLEKLAIKLTRSRGELAAYAILGSFPRLTHVEIVLDCSIPPVARHTMDDDENDHSRQHELLSYSSSDGFLNAIYSVDTTPTANQWPVPMVWHSVRNGHIRNTIMSASIDATFARSLFQLIERSKPAGSSRLQRLDIHSEGGTDFTTATYRLNTRIHGLSELLETIRLSWSIERCLRHDHQEELMATRILDTQKAHHSSQAPDVHNLLKPICRAIWPQIADDFEDWWEKWYSFPIRDA